MKFILSDESLNVYGFRVLTDGIDIEDFKKNPIMFYNHNRSLLPIGRWNNIKKVNGQLIADPQFYEGNDEIVNSVKSRVEQGIISCASIGFEIVEASEDPTHLLKDQLRATITKSKIFEASIVDVPANKNAIKFRNGSGLLLSGDIPDSILELSLPKINKMENSENNGNESLTELKDKLKKMELERATLLVDSSIELGKISKDERALFLKLAQLDFDETSKVLSNRKNIVLSDSLRVSSFLQKGGQKEEKSNKSIKPKSEWNLDDYRKNEPTELLKNPQLYEKLIKQEFESSRSI